MGGEERRVTRPTNQKHIKSWAVGQADQRVKLQRPKALKPKKRDYYELLMTHDGVCSVESEI